MDNKIIVAILIIGVLAVGGYLFYNLGATVSATGQSSIRVKPDEVSVYFNIETRNASVQEAKDANDIITENVVNGLLELGINKSEIQFSSYNTYPEYDYGGGQQKIKGYVVSQQIVLRTGNFDIVPRAIDNAIKADALVNYVYFELSDEKQGEYKKQVLEEASKDARERAAATAAGLGKSLGRLISVQSQDFYYQPWVLYDHPQIAMNIMTGEKGLAIDSIQPQDEEVTAAITVQYKLI